MSDIRNHLDWALHHCPETYDGMHGTADRHGRCPYCRRKYDSAWPMPSRVPVSDLTEYYDRFYDPDWGAA